MEEVMAQSPSEIFMMRPAKFMFNTETAVTNHYQDLEASMEAKQERFQRQAVAQFDGVVETLRKNSIKVKVFQDTEEPAKPDAIFPNNWITSHQQGEMVLYPMATPNRRIERSSTVTSWLEDNFEVSRIIDLSSHELAGKYLEGTGSIVFDHKARIAYACESVRTNPEILEILCREIGYKSMTFKAADENGSPIYHTNVMMSVCTDFVVCCLEAVRDEKERKLLIKSFEDSEKKCVDISYGEVSEFAGNCYEILGTDGRKKFVMSSRAWEGLGDGARDKIKGASRDLDIVTANVEVIEKVGGGGVRCMIAPIFNKRKH